MKKFFAAFGLLVLVGGGCFSRGGTANNDTPKNNNGDEIAMTWWLEFDLPEGWVEYAYYDEDVAHPEDVAIQSNGTDIVLQSTALPIVLQGKTPGSGVEAYEDEDYTYIRVFRYDPRTSIPDEAEDLGDGFYKRTVREDQIDYFFKGETGNYKFVIDQEMQDLSIAEEVIFSAKE